MGLAQAVSLPRGGGTLKGQRPLPAAADPPPPSPTPPESRPPHPHREARRRPEPGGGPQGERGAAPEVVLPGGGGRGGRGARAEGAWRAGSQAASVDWAAGARRALCQAPGGGGEERTGRKPGGGGQEKERAAGSLWVPGTSS